MASGGLEANYILTDREFQKGLVRVEEATRSHARMMDLYAARIDESWNRRARKRVQNTAANQGGAGAIMGGAAAAAGVSKAAQAAAAVEEKIKKASAASLVFDGVLRRVGTTSHLGSGAVLGLGASLGMAVKGMKAYAELTGESEAATARFAEVWKQLLADAGRGLSQLGLSMGGAAGIAEEMGDRLRANAAYYTELKLRTVDGLTQSQAQQAVLAQMESDANEVAQQRLNADRARTDELIRQQRAANAELSTDERLAQFAKLRLEVEQKLAEARKVGSAANYKELTDLIAQYAKLRGEQINKDRDTKAAEDAKRAQEKGLGDSLSDFAARERRIANDKDLAYQVRAYEIENMRMAGKTKEADIARERLDLEQRILAIWREKDLSYDKAVEAEKRLRGLSDERIKIIEAGDVKEASRASVAVGLGRTGTAIASAVFGGGISPQKQLVTGQNRMVAVLGKIEQNTRQGATYR